MLQKHSEAKRYCRKVPDVIRSTENLQTNSGSGGHVWEHVYGLSQVPRAAKSSESQKGKTMFVNEGDFKMAWDIYQKLNETYLAKSAVSECNVKAEGQNDCVRAKDVQISEAYKCISADEVTKLCDNLEVIEPLYVVFYYHKSQNTGGRWVLNTMEAEKGNFPHPQNAEVCSAICGTLLRILRN